MQKRNFAIVICLSATIFLASCSKEDDNTTPPAKTKTELLTTGTWKFSTAFVGPNNVNAFLQGCQKDNIMTFTAAGLTGTLDEGLTKCNAGDPQTSPFTWSFASGETVLNISTPLFTGGSSTFTLVSLTATELKVSQNITVSGTTQNAVVTFIH
ncbi:hypothetical protein CAP36_06255 [Chitinophagaceae bacterium IBVUCB2]|nr:hypothetical protein CAP36_06255 [Chitinophagaceae bacterium IBVUCB2]